MLRTATILLLLVLLSPAALAACGDGVLEQGERCDDGNTNNEDFCSNACTVNTNAHSGVTFESDRLEYSESDTTKELGVRVSDTAVYDTGHYSTDGGRSWEEFTLTGEQTHNRWILSQAQHDLPIARNAVNNTHDKLVATYSCNWNSGWDCHGGVWQIKQFNVTTQEPEPQAVCGNGIIETGEECEPGNIPTTCQQQGYDNGSISCTDSCELDTSSCTNNPPSGEAQYLVDDGNALADIVIAPDTPNMVQLAAKYFQNDIADMTGATLPINNAPDSNYDMHVYIGESQYTDDLGISAAGTENDGYKIVSGDGYLVLLGDDRPYDVSSEMSLNEWDAHTAPDVWGNSHPAWQQEHRGLDVYSRDGRGTMNAIHDFLRGQGMRYYYPNSFGTITPSKQDVAVEPTNKLVNSPFAMRSPYHYYKRFRHLSNSGLYPEGVDFGSADEWFRFLMSMGLNHEQSSVIGKVAHGHDEVITREETKQAHPEYYAVWSGERMNGEKMKPNYCSDGLKQETIRYVDTMFTTYGSVYGGDQYVSIWPADGFTRVSEHSQECRDKATPEYGSDGRISDYVWNFINDVAWAIYDEHGPGHYVMGGAYSAYKLPPQDIENPRGFAPNIAVMIAHNRHTTADPDEKQYRQQLVSDWDELAPGQVFMNDKYRHNVVDATSQSVPHFYPHIISEDIKFLEGKSNGEFTEVATNNPTQHTTHDAYAATGLNMYITSRMFWTPDADVDAILDEYYSLYYGPAAETMQQLVEYSENNLENSLVTNPEHLDIMRATAEQAINEVPSGSVYEERIQALLGLMNSEFEGTEATVDSCQTLTSPGTTYKLALAVSSEEQCFFIDANGITLDCQGFTISSGGDGVFIDGRQTNRGNYYTIKNCDIDAGGYGIFAKHADHGTIENNNVEASDRAIWTSQSTNLVIRDNYAYSSSADGAYIQLGGSDGTDLVSQNTIENNVFETDSGRAATLYNVNGDTVENNEFRANSGYGLRMFYPANTLLKDNLIETNSGSALYIQDPINLTQEGNTVNEG